MSGHSKWSTIKHKKGRLDAQRGRTFSKLIKEITVAAKMGGGDPDSNPRLRTAVASAKSVNMPNDNIDRAIKKGTGELPGVTYEESFYEGYGPGGVAVLVRVLTDNRNRTTPEIRHLLSKAGGSLGGTGSVAWLFEDRGVITVNAAVFSEDDVLAAALEAGADDMSSEESSHEILTEPGNMSDVVEGLRKAGIEVEESVTTKIPSSTKRVEGAQARQVLKLLESLEENEDVQEVYSNFDMDENILEEASQV
ncbi:YebC/PmpR family DNA-binding transcriptional regulator [candidate division KSB1 bacterium]